MSTRLRALTAPSIILGLGAAASAGSAAAASLDVKIDLPRRPDSEFHRPYVSFWIESATGPARTLSVWYDSKNREEGGRKWLAEMRTWWRKTGRTLTFPADGVSGATKAVGPESISFAATNPALVNLPPGQYTLGIEAAREKGGDEAVKIPFKWPPKGAETINAKGSTELGAVTLTVKP